MLLGLSSHHEIFNIELMIIYKYYVEHCSLSEVYSIHWSFWKLFLLLFFRWLVIVIT